MIQVGEILSEHRKKAGLSQIEAAALLTNEGYSIKNKGVSAWEKGLASPNAAQFLTLCKIYGITDIYSAFLEPNPDNPLSELNEEGRAKVLDYINVLKRTGDYSVANNNDNVVPFPTRELPLYLLAASAGTGEFLDSDDYEMVVVGSEVPEKASFGIRLHGNSMEPRYMNGQIVWVYRTSELFDGDIGIFYLDGEAYCKKLHRYNNHMELISFNPDYAPIQITEDSDFRIYGRVIS